MSVVLLPARRSVPRRWECWVLSVFLKHTASSQNTQHSRLRRAGNKSTLNTQVLSVSFTGRKSFLLKAQKKNALWNVVFHRTAFTSARTTIANSSNSELSFTIPARSSFDLTNGINNVDSSITFAEIAVNTNSIAA